MGCARFEVLLVDAHGEAKQKRDWTGKQLLDSVPWLKRMNARGHNVLIRPSGRTGMTLFDRLTQVDVAKLERTEVPVSAKIQVEEDRFQFWLNLGSAEVSEKLRVGIAKKLGLRPPDGAEFGALAGFVNRQSEAHQERSRFVLAHQPIKLVAGTIVKWADNLKEAAKLLRVLGRGKTISRAR